MSKYTLTYERNKSQEIYIETINEIGKDESLYFNKEYDEAMILIKAIVEAQTNNRDSANYSCNNRILFTGQRGCGKTSVMRSLAEYLSNKSTGVKYNEEKIIKFSCLPMVDPSHFDNNNNILLTVITNMFSVAKKKMNKEKDGGDTATREDLLKQFEKVFKSLDSIKSELTSYTLESLNRKSDAEDLKDKIKKLVHKYLSFQDFGDESRLVLLIDDIDMSVSYAPEMLEQLRKYLELDNLIILMSANLGQLYNEMREKYSSAFQYTLKDSNQALSIDVEDLATKYLLKLFPTSRRINVERNTSQLLETDLIIKEPGKEEIKDEFQKVILSLIWSKTRLLFIPKDSKNTLHPIIPTNLRDLAQFLDMLMALPNIKIKCIEIDDEKKEYGLFADSKAYDDCKDNLRIFQNYVMKTWIPNHLNVEEELVFHNIPTDIAEINKHLINSINIIGTKHKDDLMSREVGLDIIERNADNVFIDRDIYTMVSPNDPKFVKANKISDIFNQPSNYSYGDLLLMIDKYETYFESEEHRKFTDAIKIYYTILLFDTMFFKSSNIDYSYGTMKKFETVAIQRLIGGNVYYPNYFEIITDKNFNQKGPSYDAKRAFYHKVKVDGKKVGDTYPLFAVLYYGDIRPDRYEKNHIYDTTFIKNAEVDGMNFVTFDILSILNNMLNPCHTLSRLDDEKYKPEERVWGEIVDNIKKWGIFNEIEKKPVPNAILPFYSVDVMLAYLRSDYSTDVLFQKASVQYPNIEDAKRIVGYIDDFFDASSNERIDEVEDSLEIINQNKSLFKDLILFNEIAQRIEKISIFDETSLNKIVSALEFTDEEKQELNKTISKETLSETDLETLNGLASKFCLSEDEENNLKSIGEKKQGSLSDDEKTCLANIASKVWWNKSKEKLIEISKKQDDLSPEDRKIVNVVLETHKMAETICGIDSKELELLKDNLRIIRKAFDCYKTTSIECECDNKNKEQPSLIELYRNHVIALILGNSKMAKKEKEALIKEVHKYYTVSEIYKHLVEVLWKNAITEICIRGKIQEKIRSFEVVKSYYTKLKEETCEMFKLIDGIVIDENKTKLEPIALYKCLFEKAELLFLNK